MKLYGATIFLAAFLLFQIEPLIARYLVPWFGGSASVWTTCLVFFQILLTAGYATTHAGTRFLNPRRQAVLQLFLVACSMFFLPVIPGSFWRPTVGHDPGWQLLLLLLGVLGLPYLALAASSPLIQRWAYLSRPESTPYGLFALSNAGSFLALLGSPLLLDPLLTRRHQSLLWAAGFVLYGLLSLICVMRGWRSFGSPSDLEEGKGFAGRGELGSGTKDPAAAVAPPVAFLWVALSACASLLLYGVTGLLCRGIASIPLLWVLPLALYLLSFILCFAGTRWYPRRICTALSLPLIALMGAFFGRLLSLPMIWVIPSICSGLFFFCVVCHGELYRIRPHPSRITLFYLLVSLGGVLGGVLAVFIAPRVFPSYGELPSALGFLGVLLLVIHARERTRISLAGVNTKRLGSISIPLWPILAAGVLVLGVFLISESRKSLSGVLEHTRNFYGDLKVVEVCDDEPVNHGRVLIHSGTAHGGQFYDAAKSGTPILYFNRDSGIGLVMQHHSPESGRRVGVLGLGVGTLAAYGKRGDSFRFYEIDPDMIRIAKDRFTYLRDTAARVEIIPGDARVILDSEPEQRFDILVLDAFSGGQPPFHLLTEEAFSTYLRHLAPEGVIAVNASNTHLDFLPALLGINKRFQLNMACIPYVQGPSHPENYDSLWVLLSRDRSFLMSPPVFQASRDPSPGKVINPLKWSDESVNYLPTLRWFQ